MRVSACLGAFGVCSDPERLRIYFRMHGYREQKALKKKVGASPTSAGDLSNFAREPVQLRKHHKDSPFLEKVGTSPTLPGNLSNFAREPVQLFLLMYVVSPELL
jgi:hypothetical protein